MPPILSRIFCAEFTSGNVLSISSFLRTMQSYASHLISRVTCIPGTFWPENLLSSISRAIWTVELRVQRLRFLILIMPAILRAS
ncbi:DEAD/DEAH box helicase [Histoplasma capsulatum G186AR]|uniref:DEAD/DEAH box helicase n=1 Tax=Ajellomyces capsulatus TaxID=5037 RepID=A0A8H7YV94_AJECA|nr:DEAD/DEAH box helicase [Histoplasma capsulatum]QSS74307.1 DEAD/DEAH box helicase [Histoplasma capsulatum G186AR]